MLGNESEILDSKFEDDTMICEIDMYTTSMVCSVSGMWGSMVCGVGVGGMWRELLCGDKCYMEEVAWEVTVCWVSLRSVI